MPSGLVAPEPAKISAKAAKRARQKASKKAAAAAEPKQAEAKAVAAFVPTPAAQGGGAPSTDPRDRHLRHLAAYKKFY